ncbi:MAG: hypothetical protein A2314_02080 [Elusimicrobia bacterium RIFOXYB2_FULL_50_12]|nr:MAG: hypothetical protein A2314_02080 [Elusimicrobia bacterium RIFOXYB2_FULL_50_12]
MKQTTSKTISFSDALQRAGAKKHLLLGNGFSIALKPDIFSYASLYDECLKQRCISDETKKLFNKFGTRDFEVIIRALNDTAKVLSVYTSSRKMAKQITNDAGKLKKALIDLLSAKHPANPSEIAGNQYKACTQFLGNFERIYTLNYDLLLYWVVMKALENKEVKYDDGFRYGDGQDYVVWHPEEAKSQNIYYLHGALHLFDAGEEIKKFTWINTGIRLIEQIRGELNKNNFPLFVAEGTSPEKMTKINHSQYLGRGIRSFAGIGGSLFIYGHSLADNDAHYLKFIAKNKVEKLFVSIYNDGTQKQMKVNSLIQQRAASIATARMQEKKQYPIEIVYYDALSAKVWG